MILYFSATGNTEFVAKQLAKRLDDECINLLDRIKNHDYSAIRSKKPFVVCSPIYVCEPPRFLCDYLRKVSLVGNRNIYYVFTSGGYAGIADSIVKRITKRSGMKYMGWTELVMPRNYVASDAYDMLDKETARKRIRESARKLPRIAAVIKTGQPLHGRYVFLFEKVICLPFNPVWVKIKQPAEPFHTNDKCVGCGKCEKVCPLNNIKMVDGKPCWEGPCAHCMACIGNCPVEAIQYGNITQKKEIYNIRKHVKKKFL